MANLVLDGPGDAQISPLLEPVPRAPRFIGRERELGELRARLERQPMVAIRGMAGEGKSLLGARLAREVCREDQICWFTFDPIEKNTVDALFWSMAAFLAKRGEALLWRYLHGEIEAHRPLDRTVRLNLFLSSAEAAGCVFCFDDVQLVSDEPEIGELFKSLQRLSGAASEERRTRFVIMGRDLPREIEHLAEPLTGFTSAEVQALLEGHGLQLPEPLTRQLRERTHGNPTLVELAVSSLQRMDGDHDAMARFLDSMAGRGDIRDYVMNHMYADLSADEKAVVDALSIFPVPVDLQLAEDALRERGVEGIGGCLDSLIQKAIVRETDARHVYCHSLVRDFCQRSLDGRLKRSLHARAADHYEAEKNPLRAAYHTLEQGEAERALSLLSRNVRAIIDAGGAASLLELLGRFDVRAWDDAQQLAFVLLKGEALTVRGQYREAVRLYEAALDDVLDDEGRAELLSRLGTTGNDMGDHEQAIAYAMEGLEALSLVDDDAATARLQRVLGMAHYRLGRLEEASTAFQEGLALAERGDDPSLCAYLDQYLGLVDARMGRLDEARVRLEKSRRAFRQLRDRTGEAEATGNLAMVYGMLGKADREHSLHLKVLEILEEVGDVGYLLILHNNLGDIQRRAGRFEEALSHYEKLVDIAARIEHRPWLGGGYVGLAETLLASGKVEAARRYAEKAHELLQQSANGSGASIELAMSRRVLGEVHLALGDAGAARRWFETCIPPLEETHEVEELAKARQGYEAAVARTDGPPNSEEREWSDGNDVQT
ncbi:MAG: tetratricopeptide repeat protein [Polyangiales bacterium]